jgi:hypothetical protein
MDVLCEAINGLLARDMLAPLLSFLGTGIPANITKSKFIPERFLSFPNARDIQPSVCL